MDSEKAKHLLINLGKHFGEHSVEHPGRYRMRFLGLRTALCSALVVLWTSTAFAQYGDIDSPYGVNAHAPIGTNQFGHMDNMIAAGVDWYRMGVAWNEVELVEGGGPGTYNWSRFDNIRDYVENERATNRNINVLWGVDRPPVWHQLDESEPADGRLKPSSYTAWTDFVTLATERYKDTFQHYAFFNEPDRKSFSGTGVEYADEILSPAAAAVRAADPGALIVGPHTSNLTSTPGTNSRWYDFLYDVMNHAGDDIDIIADHNYDEGQTERNNDLERNYVSGGYNQSYDDPSNWGDFDFSCFCNRHPSLRVVLEQLDTPMLFTNGSGYLENVKEVWLGEIGWRSSEFSSDPDDPYQANNLTQFFTDWFGGDPNRAWLDKAFIYHMGDDNVETPGGYGLMDFLNTIKKPGYYAYADFITDNPFGSAPSEPPAEPPAEVIPEPATGGLCAAVLVLTLLRRRSSRLTRARA